MDLITQTKARITALSQRSSTRHDAELMTRLLSHINQALEVIKPLVREAEARAPLGLGEDIDHWPVDKTNLTLGDFRLAKAFQDNLKEKCHAYKPSP